MDANELDTIIKELRAKQPPAPPPGGVGWQPARKRGPEALAKIIERVGAFMEDMPQPTPEEMERRRKEEIAAERSKRWRQFAERLGPRYLGCRLSNFTIGSQNASAMEEVVSELKRYGEDMPERVEAGQGVLLFGSVGTGKDHLLTALAHSAIVTFDMHVRWVDGTAFYRQVRDRMDSRDSEAELIERFSLPSILYFSDPLPPFGDLTPFQASALFSVIDRRYRDRKPTWLSLNVADSDEAARRLGPSIVDRMKDNTLVLRCNWPSYRKVAP
jgi:DNA replication protein DnaC